MPPSVPDAPPQAPAAPTIAPIPAHTIDESLPPPAHLVDLDLEDPSAPLPKEGSADEEIAARLEAELAADLEVSWGEVCSSCFRHTPKEWFNIFLHVCGILFFVYFFLFALDLLGAGAKVIGGCSAGGFLAGVTNPIAGVVIGELVTVLMQSSSTTTSIVVSIVGAGGLTVRQGIYLIMGANIGTSVTNTLVALGQMSSVGQLEKAFAAATVHDCFNVLSVIVLLPIEAATGYLYYLTLAMLPPDVANGDSWTGPIKTIVGPLTKLIVVANKNMQKGIATQKVANNDFYVCGLQREPFTVGVNVFDPGNAACSAAPGTPYVGSNGNPNYPGTSDCKYIPMYPTVCTGGVKDYKSCTYDPVKNPEAVGPGAISCDKKSNSCPAFYTEGATQSIDETSGWVCFFLGIIFIVICLVGLVKILSSLILSASTRILRKATDINGYVAMAIGTGVTLLVQSSSITTSVLTPIAGLGIIPLEVVLPITLGANIGTTVTGLLAASVSGSLNALQVALAHLFFNITGIVIWYPIPLMRRVPLGMARFLGRQSTKNRFFPVIYLVVAFFIVPLILLGLSILFDDGINKNEPGLLALAIILSIIVLLLTFYTWFQYQYRGGAERFHAYGKRREARKAAYLNLATDMDYLKSEIAHLKGDKYTSNTAKGIGSGFVEDENINVFGEPAGEKTLVQTIVGTEEEWKGNA